MDGRDLLPSLLCLQLLWSEGERGEKPQDPGGCGSQLCGTEKSPTVNLRHTREAGITETLALH